ncbi:AraC-like ligand-binding domain-containing protein [Nocardia sp. R6R-6]|uniref:AraC-like ligand-binding domain-containing protein n=1 Tax=Nocardia sp. R6R-6 TaxID=3459303 RepID=UPI00403DB162
MLQTSHRPADDADIATVGRGRSELAFGPWREAISAEFVPLEAALRSSASALGFVGELRSRTLGSIQLSEVSGGAVVVSRTPGMIRRSDPGLIKLGMQVQGRSIVRQSGHEAVLTPGDFAIYDTARPYRVEFTGSCAMFVVMFPRAELRSREQDLASAVARSINGEQGIGGVLSPFLYGLRRSLADEGFRDSPMLESAVFDLVSAVLEVGSPADHEHSGEVLLASAKAFIEAHLSNIDLNTRMIAENHHISPRYLQRLFEGDGATVAGWIRRRRLEKCRKDLADARMAHLSIGAICSRHGLADSSHFSKIFKEEFGVPPREYRNDTLRSEAAAIEIKVRT